MTALFFFSLLVDDDILLYNKNVSPQVTFYMIILIIIEVSINGGNDMDRTRNRILGSLIGGAAGDALGYAVEFARTSASGSIRAWMCRA